MEAEEKSPDAGAVATVTLAGRAWPVPRLSPKQNRIVVPGLLELLPRVIRAREEGGGELAQLARFLDTAAYDLLAGIVFAALSRAHPALARAEFDALPIGTYELILALVPLARAAGLLGPAAAAE